MTFTRSIFGGLVAALLVTTAFAQSQTPTPRPATPVQMVVQPDPWRASKLIGVNVYNDQNEKLGDINEVLLDQSGKVAGVVLAVGGFLGMGEHYVMVGFDKLKWVNEPVRTSSTTTTTTTTGSNAPATTTVINRAPNEKWYPDHAILSGATKDQLKSMPQFKYN